MIFSLEFLNTMSEHSKYRIDHYQIRFEFENRTRIGLST